MLFHCETDISDTLRLQMDDTTVSAMQVPPYAAYINVVPVLPSTLPFLLLTQTPFHMSH